MKTAVKRLIGTSWLALGADRLLRVLKPGRFAVLMFHRIVDAPALAQSANSPLMLETAVFEAMAACLARECHCLPLSRVVELAGAAETSSKPVVALTFDDGYADFYEQAYPILTRHRLPATMYLATDYIDHADRFFWWDAVEAFFAAPQHPGIFEGAALPGWFLEEMHALMRAPSPRRTEAFIRGPMYRLEAAERRRFLDLLPVRRQARPAMLAWDQVRSMAASGLVDFGPHCLSHPLLDEVAPQAALEEITASARRIVEEVGRTADSFAYPSGRVPADYAGLLGKAGIDLAVTTRFGGNDAASDRRLLRRMDARLCLAGEGFDRNFFLAACTGGLDWLQRTREASHGLVG